MAKPVKKYYVVWHGLQPGIYESWSECLAQVKSFPNARYKAFKTLQEAKSAYNSSYEDNIERKSKPLHNINSWESFVPAGSIAVDAACSGNPGDLEYRGVNIYEGSEIFKVGPLSQGTNNIGEFLAIVHALALLKKKNDSTTIIFSDSKIAINWVKLKKPNTKLTFTNENIPIRELLSRAVNWLQQNSYNTPIKKWETEQWGENPADFGRK